MNKSDFITCLSGRLPYDKEEIEFLLNIIVDVIVEGLANDRQVKTPLGTYKVETRKPRRIRTIHDKKLTTLPSKEVVKFLPNKKIEEKLNGDSS